LNDVPELLKLSISISFGTINEGFAATNVCYISCQKPSLLTGSAGIITYISC